MVLIPRFIVLVCVTSFRLIFSLFISSNSYVVHYAIVPLAPTVDGKGLVWNPPVAANMLIQQPFNFILDTFPAPPPVPQYDYPAHDEEENEEDEDEDEEEY
jgi:hypothetical protein